jgi:hypothetical protein
MRIMDDAMAVEAGNWVVATAWFSEHAADRLARSPVAR